MTSTVFLLAAFFLAAGLEVARPWRSLPRFAIDRWIGNLTLLLLGSGIGLLVAPIVALPALAGSLGERPLWLQLAVGVATLDGLSYGLHRAFHASPILWRLHALHHSDPELDVSTAVRHHPGEALIVGLIVGVFGGAAGFSPLVVGLYGSLNLAVQIFAHANTDLPKRVGMLLGAVVITPALHRVHHSRQAADIASNFGLVFSIWDRVFGSYRGSPERGEDGIEFGIDRFREKYYQRLDRMLWLPVVVRATV